MSRERAAAAIAASSPWSIVWTGPGLLLASLMIAWGAESSQFFVAQGLALAILAWLQTLPEFAVEAVLGYHQQSQYLLANLTGALRLLTGLGWPMIYLSAAMAYRAKNGGPMRKFTLPGQQSIQVVGLAGCLATSSPYGNFVQDPPAGYDRTVAEDAARQLAVVYPPANTRVELQQATPDAFGRLLTASLRAKGYAIREFTPSPAARDGAARGEGGVASGANNPVRAAPVLPLRYVLDRAADGNLYRVTLMVGEQSLARAYVAQHGALHPAGAWMRREAQP